MENQIQKKERQSGIELLKIFAIILIILSHTISTIGTPTNIFTNTSKAFFNINLTSNNPEIIFLIILKYFVCAGNFIFMICTAWFLIDSHKTKKSKVLNLIIDVFIISVFFLILLSLNGVNIEKKLIIKSIFPTIFANNWYITCYILIYMIHPFLNIIIENIEKRKLLLLDIILFFVYFGICWIQQGILFNTDFIIFLAVYFLTAYIKKYMIKFNKNIKQNILVTIVSSILIIVLALLLNTLGNNVEFLHDKALKLYNMSNPLVLLLSFSLFNIFKEMKFINKTINYISSLSMLIYVIHENLLVRTYIRPLIYVEIFNKFGHNMLVLQVFCLVILIFVTSIIASILYKASIQKVTKKISDSIVPKIEKKIINITDNIMKIE